MNYGGSAVTGLANRVTGHVHIIGAGLLGASIGLNLTQKGTVVTLADNSPTALALASDYGAGTPLNDEILSAVGEPQLVIVATPPETVATVVAAALKTWPKAVVTDVASVKLPALQELRAAGIDTTRYVGSHPMAGREKGSAVMARADLFVGRPWVICRDAETPAAALNAVEALAIELGAVPTEWEPQEHDAAVAMVSHLPQIVASVLAAQLNKAQARNLNLSGGGVRDTTRIAKSDPELWVQILGANHAEIAPLLRGFAEDLETVATAIENPDQRGSRSALADLIDAGNRGVERLPGKHGSTLAFANLQVIVADSPGQLARLLTDLEELKINMEDLRLEHSPGAEIGFANVAVLPEVADRARTALGERGWRIL
ncbi:prephenate dehydrogenase [Canibacter zhoujuaniae]|uniref:prephenate dehydrogenase n=1 Tax=Canibacter zhoujuaniae TaxID=2708343 RepID=UPI001AB03ECA|nr:prephenate dehydrogenase [Canibacter zhoujuaniae]